MTHTTHTDITCLPLSLLESVVSTPCPECTTAVVVPSDVLEGELIVCDHCGVELEVLTTDPAKLAIFEEEEK